MESDYIGGGRSLRIAVGIITLAILLLAGGAGATTFTVNASGGANYIKIQDAIDDASAGDTILVYSGTYYENLFVKKALILKGIDTGEGKPVVDAKKNGSAVTLSAGNSTFEGFATVNTSGGWPINAGILVTLASNNIIRNNIVSNNWNGVYLQFSSNNDLSGNTVASNTYGVYLQSSNNNELNGNNISNNWDGIYLDLYNNENIINDNTVSSNNYLGIYISSSNNNILSGNTVNSNYGSGVFLSSSNNNILSGNIAANNKNNNGIVLYSSSGNVLTNNIANSNNYDGILLDHYSNNNILNNNTASNNNWGVHLWDSNDNTLSNNTVMKNFYGVYLYSSINNTIYNNYFNNTNNAFDNGNNIWNITKTYGTNIIGGPYLGGNYWSDYAGSDLGGDGLGDTLLPYNSLGNITNGGDFLPLKIAPAPTAGGSISGFKINDTNGNGRWDASEKGISNWTIRLVGITGKGKDTKVIRKETFTDAMGFYKFDNLPAGRYFVIEKLKKRFVPTSSPVKRVKLAQDGNSINNHFTNRPINSRDKIDSQRDVDDYEVINRDIDKYEEEMD